MGMILASLIFMAILSATTTFARVLPKRSDSGDYPEIFDYPDFNGKSDEYPVASKRAALLLDRLMVALQKAVEDQGIGESRGERDVVRSKPIIESPSIESMRSGSGKTGMDLQRRAHVNNSVYWRCYFNAVTCFKKK